MSKALRKAIMMHSRMKNLHLKNKHNLNWSNYKKQKNFCENLLRKTKKSTFQSSVQSKLVPVKNIGRQ